MKNEKKTAAMTPERREKDKVKQEKKKTVTMAAEIRKKDKSKTVEKKPATALESRKKEKAASETNDDDAPAADAVATVSTPANKSGVIYLGGLVHGFYEHQLRSYFEQFGEIRRLRISRNKKTGASRHHAFIQFAEPSTAEIVAKATDGYLIMGHILRCRVMAPEAVHEDIWKGAGRRFKTVPWALMAGRRLERAATESVWERRIAKEERRRKLRAEKLKGLEYEFDGPALKAAEAKEVLALEGAGKEEAKAIEAAPVAAAE